MIATVLENFSQEELLYYMDDLFVYEEEIKKHLSIWIKAFQKMIAEKTRENLPQYGINKISRLPTHSWSEDSLTGKDPSNKKLEEASDRIGTSVIPGHLPILPRFHTNLCRVSGSAHSTHNQGIFNCTMEWRA